MTNKQIKSIVEALHNDNPTPKPKKTKQKTYPVTRKDGKTVNVTIPDNDKPDLNGLFNKNDYPKVFKCAVAKCNEPVTGVGPWCKKHEDY